MSHFDDWTVLVAGGAGGQRSSHLHAFHAEGQTWVIADVDEVRASKLAQGVGIRSRHVGVRRGRRSSWSAAVRRTGQSTAGCTCSSTTRGCSTRQPSSRTRTGPPGLGSLMSTSAELPWHRDRNARLAPVSRGAIVTIASNHGPRPYGSLRLGRRQPGCGAVRNLRQTAATSRSRPSTRV